MNAWYGNGSFHPRSAWGQADRFTTDNSLTAPDFGAFSFTPQAQPFGFTSPFGGFGNGGFPPGFGSDIPFAAGPGVSLPGMGFGHSHGHGRPGGQTPPPEAPDDGLNILLTNDDGYDAPGIQSMYEALTAAGYNVTIAAPRDNQSAQGSSLGGVEALTSTIGVGEFDDQGNYWVDGRPKVVVDTALDSLLADQSFDLVVSGTNSGDNIGTSENISGTVNGAIEGLFYGIPSIAVSATAEEAGDAGFTHAADFTVELIHKLQDERVAGEPLLPEGTGLSVNVPDGKIDGVALTEITRKSSAEYPIVENEDGSYGSGYLPQESSGGSTDEGDQFLDNRITVSAIDGNWGADEAPRSALESRLSGLLGDGATEADHANLNIMLVNDDGYQAEGLAAARQALLDAGYNVTVVAPTEQQSGVGSALTLGEFEVTQYEAGYHVDATPSTTVYAGLDALLQGLDQPDLVVSGINEGANVGLQANASGTLSAAVASVFNYDIPAIAMSAGIDDSGEVPDGLYATSADFLVELIGDLQATQSGNGIDLLPEGQGLNVNVPVGADPEDFAFTLMDEANDGDFQIVQNEDGEYVFSLGDAVDSDDPNSEGAHYNDGDITLTPIDGSYQASDAVTAELSDLLGIEFGAASLIREGTAGDDELTGDTGNDWLSGGAGDDLFIDTAGNDHMDGGFGLDTARFEGNQDDYLINERDGDILVTDIASGSTDTLTSIDVLSFADGDMSLNGQSPGGSWGGHAGNTDLGQALGAIGNLIGNLVGPPDDSGHSPSLAALMGIAQAPGNDPSAATTDDPWG